MKKILFGLTLFLLAISVSACASKTKLVDQEKSAPLSAVSEDNYNLAEDETSSAPLSDLATTSASQSPISETSVQKSTIMQSPDKQENLTKTYSQAIIKTNLGNITVKFYAAESPLTVNNFLNLAQAGFYNGTKFHRVIKDFMIQGGDPLSKEGDARYWGTGGPDYRFKDEFNTHKLVLGSLAMANSGADTNGSQFFIVTISETPWLDGKHTNFGQVTDGLDIVKKIEATPTGMNDRPLEDVVINSIELLK
jgi:cyclophilin family peptidyl-prolyl cis-trans isomerase